MEEERECGREELIDSSNAATLGKTILGKKHMEIEVLETSLNIMIHLTLCMPEYS